MTEPTTPKRGPGRPRKTPPAETVELPDTPAEPKPPSKPAAKQAGDERIGRPVPTHWDSVGFDDGRQYLCENGFIVERVG